MRGPKPGAAALARAESFMGFGVAIGRLKRALIRI
jgi:hypothetical protein